LFPSINAPTKEVLQGITSSCGLDSITFFILGYFVVFLGYFRLLGDDGIALGLNSYGANSFLKHLTA